MKTKNNFFLFLTAPNTLKALIVLLIGLILTIVSVYFTKQDIDRQTENEFKLVCNEIKTKINTRLHSHALLLRTSAALWAASDTVTREDWKAFCELSKINRNLPGIQGLGFSYIIPKSKLQKHIKQIQKEGFPNYTIRPAGDREIYTSIIYLEPFTGRNLRAFSFDMFSEPIRRKAMELARDNDIASISGKVILVQETNKNIQSGTLMYVPVYKRNMPTNTIDERRKAIIGWAYSPYRMNDLMQGIIGSREIIKTGRIQLQIFDIDNLDNNSLLFDSNYKSEKNINWNTKKLTIPICFNGKYWYLHFIQHNTDFTLYDKVLIVLILGILISILLFILVLTLFNTKQQAQIIAEKLTFELQSLNEHLEERVNQRTFDLKQSEDKFRMLFDNMTNGFTLYELIEDKKGNVEDIKILEINEIGAYYFNSTRIDIIDKTIKELTNSFNVVDHKNTIEVAKTGNAINFERYSKFQDTYLRVYMYSPQKNRTAVILEDISEKRKIEENLKKSELQLKTLLNTIPDLVWLKDTNGIYIFCNSMYEKRFSLKESEIIGKTDYDFLEKEFADNFTEFDKKTIESKKAIKYENLIFTKDGQKALMETIKVPTFDSNGEIIGLLGIARDITERKREQQELINIEERFNYFSSLASEGLMIHNNGIILDANKAFSNLINYNHPSEIIGKNGLEIIPMTEESKKIVTENIKTNYQASYIIESRQPNGSIYLELKGTEVKYKDQKARLVFFNNVTDRILNEKALKESEERFRFLSLNASEGMIIHQNDIIVDANNAFANLIGIKSTNDIIGKNGLTFLRFTNESKELIYKYKEKDPNATYIVDLVKHDGTIIHLENNGRDIIYKGQKARLVLFRDVTERVNTQNTLKERNQFIESIVNLSPDTLYIYDIVEHKNIFINNGIEEILGFTIEEVKELGNEFIPLLMHPDDFADYNSKIIPSYFNLKDAESINHEYRLKDKMNNWHWIESSEIIYKRDNDGTPTQVLGYGKDITNRKNLEQQILKSVIDTEEKERLFFSQELHDGIGPLLSASKMYTQWLARQEENTDRIKIINDIEKLLDESMHTIREMSFKLSPHILQNFGLEEALKNYCDKLQISTSTIFDLTFENIQRINEKIETIMYRVLSECITNSIKHSQASKISINIRLKDNILYSDYIDNGNGFDLEKVMGEYKGIGILNMQSRIKSINGLMDLKSEINKGTTIKFQVYL